MALSNKGNHTKFDLTIPSTGDSLTPISSLYVILETLLFLAITFGNGMVIISFIKFPGLRQKLPHHWLLHLAIADLFLGLALPFHIFLFLTKNKLSEHIEGTPFVCLARYGSATLSVEVSLVLLVLLALHVLLSVQYPYKYNVWITPTKLHAMAGATWIICIAYCAIPFFGVHNYHEDWTHVNGRNGSETCELAIIWEAWYLIVMVGLMLLLIITLCTIYYIIFRLAAQRSRRDSAIISQFTNISKRNTKAARTFLLVSASTVVCFVPFAICVLIQSEHWYEYGHTTKDDSLLSWLGAGSVLCLFFHSCLNPVIYSLRLPAFRHAFRAIFTGNCREFRRTSIEQQ
ncbi:hypothetical protein BV898_03196 [Hypsibius exemplaris]|uniref:G-protein coupled receptors family 1 profile domain-containing protein n=1 Tax=Hypsibius exemplaris TaxID=2072580 RepID=A0A1W0X5F9_HYPEX|nr:hypothetical protein BV898_03196 [Hypsibius exemplaris]